MAEQRSDRTMVKMAWVAYIVHFIPLLLVLTVAAIAHLWVIDIAMGAWFLLFGGMAARMVYLRRHGRTPKPFEQAWVNRHPWRASLVIALAVIAVAEVVVALAVHRRADRDTALAVVGFLGVLFLPLMVRFWIACARFGNRMSVQMRAEQQRFAEHRRTVDGAPQPGD
jgi:hypothetical protein